MSEKICPNCGSMRWKQWSELTEDQKFLVERMPASARFAPEQRKKHRFCARCFYETADTETRV